MLSQTLKGYLILAMLRSVCFKNFVKFKEYQVLDFSRTSKGPFIFIGENGSGKSSVFEGIRRCLKLRYSTSISTVPDSNIPSYFICSFKRNYQECEENIICGIVSLPATGQWKHESDDETIANTKPQRKKSHHKSRNSERRLTKASNQGSSKNVNKTDQSDSQRKGMHYYKFAMKCSKSDPMFINFIGEYKDENEPKVSSYKVCSSDFPIERGHFITTILKQNQEGEKYIQEYICKVFRNMRRETDNNLEPILDTLSKDLVFTFPLRSIGPLQWSESKRIRRKFREDNYNQSEKRCEIIRHFLKNGKRFDLVKESTYFEQLTQFVDYKFELKDRKINLPKGKFALLKTPEGILEAKAFSILISSKQYKTILLEEPDRGMHPQLVERMIQIINQEKDNKRVILTTHQKQFITPWTVSDTFIFRRCGNENRLISCKSIFGEKNDANVKKKRLLTSHHVPDILFANKVLFCEGESEELFLGELKRQILSGECSINSKLFDKHGKLKGINRLKNCLMEYTIIKMNGKDNREFYQHISTKLQLDHLVLVDRDAIDDILRQSESKQNRKQENDPVNTRSKEEWKVVRLELLQKKRIFFWLDGDIEKMVTAMRNYDACLKQPLQKLKVVSTADGASRSHIKGKLFLNDKIKSSDITESVKLILKHCKPEDDLAAFIKTLIKCPTENHIKCERKHKIDRRTIFLWLGFILILVLFIILFLYGGLWEYFGNIAALDVCSRYCNQSS